MIKRYKRTHSGWMRRTSRIYLKANKGKLIDLHNFLNNYTNAVNYSITRFWSEGNKSSELASKDVTDRIREQFGVTARLAQCIAKQAKEVVKGRDTMPRIKKHTAILDSRFVTIEAFDGHFDMCIKFGSGVPKIVVPFKTTKHMERYDDWEMGKSIRMGYDGNGVFVDLIFEKERPELRTVGDIMGIDRGYKSMLYTSDEQDIGNLSGSIKSAGKRRKSYHHYITTEENRCLKELNFTGIKAIVLENLKNVKRGKFRRNMNRLLSFWHYAKVGNRLEQICEELGIAIYFKNPAYTSQRCPDCGNIDRKNRKGKSFKCLKCDASYDADHVGALNLKTLGLAGAYSLRSLKNNGVIS